MTKNMMIMTLNLSIWKNKKNTQILLLNSSIKLEKNSKLQFVSLNLKLD